MYTHSDHRLPLIFVVVIVILAGVACNRGGGPQVEDVAPPPAEQAPADPAPAVEEPAAEQPAAEEDDLTQEELEALSNELDALLQEFEQSASQDPEIELP